MASKPIYELTEITALADTDVMYVVDDPGSTPLDRKASMSLLWTYVVGKLADSTELTLASSATSPAMFRNADDSDMYVGFRSGSTTEQREYLAFYAFNAADPDWLIGRNATNHFILFDRGSATHRLYAAPGGHTYLSSSGASTAIIVNGYAGESGQGTGGLLIYSGGVSPSLAIAIHPTNGIYSGSSTSLMRLYGGSANNGGGVLLCGGSHASYAGMGLFRSSSTDILIYGPKGVVVGGNNFPASGTNVFAIKNGTEPGNVSADTFLFYAADISDAGSTDNGKSVCHVKTEFGNVIKLYKVATLTQTYATADPTLDAWTPDDESAAYATTGAGADIASKADLNALRVAYENLRAAHADLRAFVNSLVDAMQATGLIG